jgi:thiol-disulfide isomerase/thioredoxin
MGGISGLVSLALAAAVSILGVGDPAPSLDNVLWIKGKTPSFGSQITIVEMWRPSCGNCKAQIPHLTSLKKQYGDRLAIAAISKEPIESIAEFMKTNGSQMEFAVGKAPVELSDKYMEGISGVPYAYLVNRDGLIVWKGHPSGIDEILVKIIDGRLDLEQLKNIAQLETSLGTALKTNNPETIIPVNEKLLAADPANEKALEVGMSSAKYKHNPAMVKEMFDRVPVSELGGEKANLFAAMLISEDDLAYRYPDGALRFSFHALTKDPKNDSYMDIYARVLYTLGDVDRAVLWEKRAIAANPASTVYQSNLGYYMAIKTVRGKSDYNNLTQLPQDIKPGQQQ